MSVKSLNEVIIIYDSLTNEVIDTIDRALYDDYLISLMLSKIFKDDLENKHGLLIKYGCKN